MDYFITVWEQACLCALDSNNIIHYIIILPTVVRRYVWCRNLVNEEALAHGGLSRQKQTNKQTIQWQWQGLNEHKTIYSKGKCKGKVHPRRGHEGPHSFLNLGARCGWLVNATPRPLYPQERPDTYCIGSCVGARAGLDGCEKSRPHRDSIPGSSNP
jgi:hypothetical protein